MGNLHEMFAYSVCNGVKIVKNKQNLQISLVLEDLLYAQK